MMTAPRIPEPTPDLDSEPYWRALADGAFVVQRCAECRRFQHLPTAACRRCLSFDVHFEPVSGRGEVYTFVTIHHVISPAYAELAPYSVAWVELPEQTGLRILGTVHTDSGEPPRIGDPVQVRLLRISEETTLPSFDVVGR